MNNTPLQEQHSDIEGHNSDLPRMKAKALAFSHTPLALPSTTTVQSKFSGCQREKPHKSEALIERRTSYRGRTDRQTFPVTRAESREPKAESRKPKAESRKPKAESRKPKAEKAKQHAKHNNKRQPAAARKHINAHLRRFALFCVQVLNLTLLCQTSGPNSKARPERTSHQVILEKQSGSRHCCRLIPHLPAFIPAPKKHIPASAQQFRHRHRHRHRPNLRPNILNQVSRKTASHQTQRAPAQENARFCSAHPDPGERSRHPSTSPQTPLPQNVASTNSISTQSKRPNSNRLKPSNQANTKYQLNLGNQITTNKVSRRTLQE